MRAISARYVAKETPPPERKTGSGSFIESPERQRPQKAPKPPKPRKVERRRRGRKG
jgi:hypothetical protein